MITEPLVQVKDLSKYFPVTRGALVTRKIGDIKAVDRISFDIYDGETLGLVGESGCGKTTTGRVLLKLIEPSEGQIIYNDQDITLLNKKDMSPLRREMQIIFQDPYASLNPRLTVGEAIGEPLVAHRLASRAEAKERVLELLRVVGLAPFHYNRYPHEFSGGQRQRVGIARSLVMNPKFIVADEPVSALDVSIQAQIINLLQHIQADYALTFLFISHDLGVVRHLSDRVVVMYLGRLAELGNTEQLFAEPKHPYTQALLSAVPSVKKRKTKQRMLLTGDVPTPFNPPQGCRFHTRCPMVMPECKEVEPAWHDTGDGHFVACHLFN
ncbi:MAG: peptide ABC transporter substrate-binding protein [Candidatus Entotheonella factor]|uniref:Peptide ABC transporter substrate-binding protein n=1 Tax=Entotheonella factor TaxID=1429438 RepID=W4L4V1_ENTF1|nr:MAG: peptide ABC transporter substrate-binding protein [Candidatus Entotheonella factor]